MNNLKIVQVESDAPLKVIGQQKLRLRLSDGWCAIVTFLVSTSLVHDCILGLDVLNRDYGYNSIMRTLRYQTELYTDEIARNYRRSDIKHLCNINVIDPVSKAAKSIVNLAGIIAWTLESLRQAITNVKSNPFVTSRQ